MPCQFQPNLGDKMSNSNIDIKYNSVKQTLEDSNSDKEASNGHKYGIFYDMLFNSVVLKQRRKIKVCEIGVSLFGEGSLHAFSKLDIIESIVGIDTQPNLYELPNKAVFYQCDAYNKDTIDMIKAHHDNFDIIIDDGSHTPEDQKFFINNYYQIISTGGYLVCEDVYDERFFNLMCGKGCYGLDFVSNTNCSPNITHWERILLKEKI